MVNVWRKSRGNRFWFELAGGSSQRGFKLSGVNCILNKIAIPESQCLFGYRGQATRAAQKHLLQLPSRPAYFNETSLSIKTEIIPWLLETNNVLKDTINSLVETELVFRDTSSSLLGSNEVVSRRTTVSSQATQTYVVCVNNMDKLG